MEDSQPLRRSTRNSVVLKNEELTPRKRKVSTPVKVEPSTPSRRTRASSATPKKSLIESMNTPKKALPVLSEEDNPAGSLRTPSKRTKEISPKTPSRRRTVRESVSTPKSTKKSVDTLEEINVVANRPLTRAKRKTMGEIQAEEVIKASELEKVVLNKKDKPELKKGNQNKKDKETVSETDDNSPQDKKLEESCFATVPRVVITDIKKELSKEAKNNENVQDKENEFGTFKSRSPVKAEDVAINSPRKVPENCKSSSEASLMCDSEYIKSGSREITVDASNSLNPVENTDLSCAGNTDISSHQEQTNKNSDVVKSPNKVIDSKDNEVSDAVTTSPKKDTNLKDNKDNVTSSPQKITDLKDDVPNIVITTPSPRKVVNSKLNEVPDIVITSPSPRKSAPVSKDGSDRSLISDQKTNQRKHESNSSTVSADTKDTDVDETLKAETTSDEVDVEKSNTSDEKTLEKMESEQSSPKKSNENDKVSINIGIEVSGSDEKKSSFEEIDENGEAMIQSDISKVSPTKTDYKDEKTAEVKLISPHTIPEDVDINISKEVVPVESVINNVSDKNSVQVASVVEMDIDAAVTQIENKDSKELNKTFDKVEPDQHVPDGANCILAKDVGANGSDSKVAMDKNNISEMVVTDVNEAVTKDDVLPNSGETKESKLFNTSDESFRPGTSCLDESTVENNPEEVDKITFGLKDSAMDEESTKDDKSTTDEASSSSPSNRSGSLIKVNRSEVVSAEVIDEDKKESENPTGVDEAHKNNEEVDGLEKGTADKSSPVKSDGPEQPDPAENELITEQKVDEGLDVAGPSLRDDSNSPIVFVRPDGEASDDSGDSGIQNDDNVLVFNVSSQLKKRIMMNKHLLEDTPSEDVGPERNVSNPESPDAKSSDNIEANAEAALEGENKGEVSGSDSSSAASVVILSPEKSDSELSPKKSDVNSDRDAENDSTIPTAVDDDKRERTTGNIPSEKGSESTEDCTSKITGLDAILMSPKDFLNSDEECNVDVEKVEDSQPKNRNENNKPSEVFVNITVDNLEHSVSETQECISLNTDMNSDPTSEDSSTKVDEKQEDSDAKSAADEVETNVSKAVLCDGKTETIPIDSEINNAVDDICVEKEKEEISSQKNITKDSSINSSEDNQNKAVSPNKGDISTKENTLQSSDSIENNESEVKKTRINERDNLNSSHSVGSPEIDVEKLSDDEKSTNASRSRKTKSNERDNLNSSQSVGSPEIDVEKLSEDESGSKVENCVKEYDLSEADKPETKTTSDSVTKNIKYTKNRRKNANKKIESETDGSESDVDSELSSSPPSNVATEGSSDGPLCGKDFIDFEAEEGEETSEDDSFIVSSGDSTESSSSSSPRFAMKMRKRKRNKDAESSDSCNYIDSVQRLFDSSIDFSKDDRKEDSPNINKKQKLEKSTSVNKKNKRPKSSILRNKLTVVESVGNRNKIKTGSKFIKEFSKTGVFIVSSLDQHFEESKLSRNNSKRNSKLRMEQKKSEITEDNYVPKGFCVIDAVENSADDAALRGFVVSYDDTHLVTKKPRKAAISSSELMSKKKKIKEGQNFKKTVKKSNSSELKVEDKSKTVSSFVVSLILPFSMTSRSISNVLAEMGLTDITSINFPKPRVAVVEFSKKESFKKMLKLYGELKINNRPIYILEGSSVL